MAAATWALPDVDAERLVGPAQDVPELASLSSAPWTRRVVVSPVAGVPCTPDAARSEERSSSDAVAAPEAARVSRAAEAPEPEHSEPAAQPLEKLRVRLAPLSVA